VGPHPYSDAASDFAATNSLAKTLGEYHDESLHPAEDRSLRQGGLAGTVIASLRRALGVCPALPNRPAPDDTSGWSGWAA
jgi:predicted cobalt transporter CbtA